MGWCRQSLLRLWLLIKFFITSFVAQPCRALSDNVTNVSRLTRPKQTRTDPEFIQSSQCIAMHNNTLLPSNHTLHPASSSAETSYAAPNYTSSTFAKCTFCCSAPAIWNSLPKTVIDSDSVTSVIFVLIYFLVLVLVLVFQLFFRFSFVLVFIIFSF